MKYWAYLNDDVSQRPYSEEELKQLEGFGPDLLICSETSAVSADPDWKTVKELLPHLIRPKAPNFAKFRPKPPVTPNQSAQQPQQDSTQQDVQGSLPIPSTLPTGVNAVPVSQSNSEDTQMSSQTQPQQAYVQNEANKELLAQLESLTSKINSLENKIVEQEKELADAYNKTEEYYNPPTLVSDPQNEEEDDVLEVPFENDFASFEVPKSPEEIAKEAEAILSNPTSGEIEEYNTDDQKTELMTFGSDIQNILEDTIRKDLKAKEAKEHSNSGDGSGEKPIIAEDLIAKTTLRFPAGGGKPEEKEDEKEDEIIEETTPSDELNIDALEDLLEVENNGEGDGTKTVEETPAEIKDGSEEKAVEEQPAEESVEVKEDEVEEQPEPVKEESVKIPTEEQTAGDPFEIKEESIEEQPIEEDSSDEEQHVVSLNDAEKLKIEETKANQIALENIDSDKITPEDIFTDLRMNVTEDSVEEKPAEDQLVEEHPVEKESTEEPVVQEEVVEEQPIEEQQVEEPVAQEEVVEEQPIEEQQVEEPVAQEEVVEEQPIEEQQVEEPVAQEKVVEEQPIEEQQVEEPVVQEEVVEEQPIEDQQVEEPVVQEEVVEEQPIEDQQVEEPAVQEEIVEEQPVEEQSADEPLNEKPFEEQKDNAEEEPLTLGVSISKDKTTAAVLNEIAHEKSQNVETETTPEELFEELEHTAQEKAATEENLNVDKIIEETESQGGTHINEDVLVVGQQTRQLLGENTSEMPTRSLKDDEFLKTFTMSVEEVFLDQPTAIISDYVPPSENTQKDIPNPTEPSPSTMMETIRREKPTDIKTVPLVSGAMGQEIWSSPYVESATVQLRNKSKFADTLKLIFMVLTIALILVVAYTFLAVMGIVPERLSPLHRIVYSLQKSPEEKVVEDEDMAPEFAEDDNNIAAAPVEEETEPTPKASEPELTGEDLVIANIKGYAFKDGTTLEGRILSAHPNVSGDIDWSLYPTEEDDIYSIAIKLPPNKAGQSFSYRFNYNVNSKQLTPTTSEAKSIMGK